MQPRPSKSHGGKRVQVDAEAILESITDAFFAVSQDWRFIYLNRQAERLLERKPGELLGVVIWEAYPGLIGSPFEKAYRLVAEQHVTASVTAYYPDHDRWYEVRVYPTPDGISVYFRDVSEQQRAQIQLRESEQRFRVLADAIPQMVWLADADGRVEFFNRQWAEYAGAVDAGVTAEQVSERFLHPDDRASTLAAWCAAMDSGEVFITEHRILSRHGEYRWFLVRAEPFRDPQTGKVLRWFGTSTDIHDSKIAEMALAKSEQRYRTLFDSIDEGLCIIQMIFDDAGRPVDYRFLETNDTFERQSGMVGALGRRMRDIAPRHEQHWFDVYAKVALTGEAVRFESHAESLSRWFEVYAFRVDDPAERKVGVLFKDITSRRTAEEELMQGSRRKDEFLAMLAHELRNPLAPISAGAELLGTGLLDARRVQETSAIIARQVRHMTSLVDDLLDVSRVTRGLVTLEQRPLDLKVVVDNAVEQVRPLLESRRHRLTVQLAAEAAYARGDHVRLVQIIANLLNNAAKYTPPQGAILLEMETEGEEVVLQVTDNGIGIAPELLGEIFELFAQGERSSDRSQGGLGLGLALVKSIVELHGGSVRAASAGPGQGSRFTIRLPRIRSLDERREAREPPAVAPPVQVDPSRVHVLVVDDNRDAAQTLGDLLKAQDYRISIAHDAQGALRLAAADAPQICILDIGLPDMDGHALGKQLKAMPALSQATFVALTGYGRDPARESQTIRFDHHLMKPASMETLYALLDNVRRGFRGDMPA